MANLKINGPSSKEHLVNVTSGHVDVEEQSFSWKIENFLLIQKFNLFDDQRFCFLFGESQGKPLKWCCFLEKESNIILPYLLLKEGPPKCKAIAGYSFQTIKPNGEVGRSHSVESTEFTLGESSFGCEIPTEAKALRELIWKDGSVLIKVNLKLFNFKPALMQPCVDLQKEMKSFENRELEKICQLMAHLIGFESLPETRKIIKIVSKDQVEFNANSGILASRSPVFAAMFSSGKWKEGQGSTGEKSSLVLEDLSGKAVKVLLHYLICGTLFEDEWNAEDVILEVTYAADKYQLDDLTELLDKVLPVIKINSVETLAKLAVLTKRLGMKNAAKKLFWKLKETATDIDQLVLDKKGSLLGKD